MKARQAHLRTLLSATVLVAAVIVSSSASAKTLTIIDCSYPAAHNALKYIGKVGGTVEIACEGPIDVDGIVFRRDATIRSTTLQRTRIRPSGEHRHMLVVGGVKLTLERLELEGGRSVDDGGSILNYGHVRLVDVRMRDNRTLGHGGAIATRASVGDGSVYLQSTEIRDNIAAKHGGGLYMEGRLQSAAAIVDYNTAGAGGGGVFFARGAAQLSTTTFVRYNRSGTIVSWVTERLSDEDIMLLKKLPNAGAGLAFGGLPSDLPSSLMDVRLYDNDLYAAPDGPAVAIGKSYFNDSDIDTFVQTAVLDSTFYESGITVHDGRYDPLPRLQVVGSEFNGYRGGGAPVKAVNSFVTLHQVTIQDSHSGGSGALQAENSGVVLTQSLLVDNMSVGGGLITVSRNSFVEVVNSTLSSNSANWGGAVYARTTDDPQPGVVRFKASTLYDTQDLDTGSVFVLSTDYSETPVDAQTVQLVQLQNTIVAGNSGPACRLKDNSLYVDSGWYPTTGALTVLDGGGNLLADDSCGIAVGPDPLLEPLDDNGGPTLTHALSPESPALDAGVCGNVTTDQRNLPRPVGAGCDVGAFEVQDDDGDGVLNSLDNCPNVANADQANQDGDTTGDVCDPEPSVPDMQTRIPQIQQEGEALIEGSGVSDQDVMKDALLGTTVSLDAARRGAEEGWPSSYVQSQLYAASTLLTYLKKLTAMKSVKPYFNPELDADTAAALMDLIAELEAIIATLESQL